MGKIMFWIFVGLLVLGVGVALIFFLPGGDDTGSPDSVTVTAVSTPTATPEPAPISTATPEPTPMPTATPEPAPISTATPELTAKLSVEPGGPYSIECGHEMMLETSNFSAEAGFASIQWTIDGWEFASGASTVMPQFVAPLCSEGPFPMTFQIHVTITDQAGNTATADTKIEVVSGRYYYNYNRALPTP